jgi:ferric-dicitrate binding protein FerR (iron transport regulator)
MSEPCTRWASLVDAEAVGETLTKVDRAFVREHVRTCELCRAEVEVWGALEGLVDEPREHESIQPPAPAPSPAPSPVFAASRRLSASRAGLALATFASLAAAAALIFAFRSKPDPVLEAPLASAGPTVPASAPSLEAPAKAARVYGVTLALASGGVIELDGRAALVGARLAQGTVLFARGGSACLAIEPGVRACVEKGSMLRISDTGENRRLELVRGRIVAELEPQPAGASFGVTTRDGSAVAIGTAFAVEVPEGDAPASARVLHGVVLVKSKDGEEQRLGAHRGTPLAAPSAKTTSDADEERDRVLAAPLTSFFSGEKAEPVNVRAELPGTKVMVDDRFVGITPVSLMLAPGEHAVLVKSEAGERREVVHVVSSTPGARAASGQDVDLRAHAELAPELSAHRVESPSPSSSVAPSEPKGVGTASAAASVAVESASAPSAAELLVAARERRMRGDLEGQVTAYRELFGKHGASPEAYAALVPYGEIQLARLGDASSALASFDRYLAGRGPLAVEAAYGRLRALRALGRTAEERAAIEAFVGAYPDFAATPSLRERAKSLGAP